MFKAFSRFFHLPVADQFLIIQGWFLLVGFDGLLRILPFERVQRFAQPQRIPHSTENALITARRLHRLIGIASRRFLQPMTCLRRSLVLQRMLSRRGIQAELRFGAKLENGILIAHAWIEVEGEPIGESSAHLSTLSRFQKGGLHGRHLWDRES